MCTMCSCVLPMQCISTYIVHDFFHFSLCSLQSIRLGFHFKCLLYVSCTFAFISRMCSTYDIIITIFFAFHLALTSPFLRCAIKLHSVERLHFVCAFLSIPLTVFLTPINCRILHAFCFEYVSYFRPLCSFFS